MANNDRLKTTAEALMDIGLFTSNVSQIVAITRSEGGVNTGEETARVVLLGIGMLLQVVLMIIFIYQGVMAGKINVILPAGALPPPPPKRGLDFAVNVLVLLVCLLNVTIHILEHEA
ncbi:PREDICTED: uncharacterized protein LOC109476022 [Branchiostoma belcheri]|uniref:Uncharacterized protein LOC109476022 n=1 Tax=Branchiostoma belcheri TaxID=7741 RepID=A0A6P4ZMV8_BRABE|nr:PREDICTED: uncharacterized protein LOC109476022 [Branchiostoma belcheri]